MESGGFDRDAHRRQMLADIDRAGAERAADPAVQEVERALDKFDADVAALEARFPPEEADQVRAGLYRTTDGQLRTRHRLLRAAD